MSNLFGTGINDIIKIADLLEIYANCHTVDEDFIIENYKLSGRPVNHIHPDLLNSEKFILEVFNNCLDAHLIFAGANERLKKDRQLIVTLMRIDPRVYKYIDDSLISDREIALYINFNQIPKKLRTDKEIVLSKFNHYSQYQEIHYSLQNDPDIIKQYQLLGNGINTN